MRKERAGHEHEVETIDGPDAGAEIRDMLARLSEKERAALILCEGHGWTHPEAAELLGMPLGTLKSTVARAKAKCRELWTGGSRG